MKIVNFPYRLIILSVYINKFTITILFTLLDLLLIFYLNKGYSENWFHFDFPYSLIILSILISINLLLLFYASYELDLLLTFYLNKGHSENCWFSLWISIYNNIVNFYI